MSRLRLRERGSLGPSGGAARVEQPGRVVRLPVDERRRRRRREPVPPLTGRHHRRLQRRDGADQRLDVVGVLGVGHDDGRLAVLEDVGDLVAVQAGVDRHGHETGVPDGEQRLEVLGPVAHHDGDPVTGRQAEVVAQAGGRGRRSGRRTSAQSAWTRSPSASAGSSGRRRPWRSTQTAGFIAARHVAHTGHREPRCTARRDEARRGRGAGPAGGARPRDPVHGARRAGRRRRARRLRGGRRRLRGRARRPGEAEGVVAAAAGAQPRGGSAGHAARRALGPRRLVAAVVGAGRAALAGRRRAERAALAARLAERYPQYRDQPFARVLVLRIVGITGWAAKA